MAPRLTVFKLNLSPVFFHGTRGGGGDTPLRPGSSSKTRFDTGAYRGVQGQIA